MNLFKIDEKIANCFAISDSEVVDTTSGEVLDIDYLNALEMERDGIIENIAKYIKNLDSDAKQLKEQKDIFAKRQKAAENKRDSLKAYLAAYLDGAKWTAGDNSVAITYRKSESVVVNDETAIPSEYLLPQPPKVDKTQLKKAIKDGAVIDGVELTTNSNIQIK